MEKIHLKSIADHINDFIAQQDTSFRFLTWYLIALDIIKSKLFVEPSLPSKRHVPKYRCNISFVNKALDFINLPKILCSEMVVNNCPLQLEMSDIPMVVYSLSEPIRSKIFNYHEFVNNLDLHNFVSDNNSVVCCCNDFDPSFTNKDHGHIITGDLNIINNNKLRKLISKGPKYREPALINWKDARNQITIGLDQYIDQVTSDKGLNKAYFSEWKNIILNLVDNKIDLLKTKIKPKNVQPVLKDTTVKNTLKSLKDKFVIVPIDKAANNVAFICKRFYASVIAKELNYKVQPNHDDINKTYQQIHDKSKEAVIDEHKKFLAKNNITLDQKMETLPTMYWIPKMHKNPVGFRFIIASPRCSIKPLSKDITSIFKLFYKKVERYHLKGRIWSGINKFWVIQNNKPVINSILNINKRGAARHISTFDFSTLYTKIPHDKLLMVLNNIVDFAFKGGTRDLIMVKQIWSILG